MTASELEKGLRPGLPSSLGASHPLSSSMSLSTRPRWAAGRGAGTRGGDAAVQKGQGPRHGSVLEGPTRPTRRKWCARRHAFCAMGLHPAAGLTTHVAQASGACQGKSSQKFLKTETEPARLRDDTALSDPVRSICHVVKPVAISPVPCSPSPLKGRCRQRKRGVLTGRPHIKAAQRRIP